MPGRQPLATGDARADQPGGADSADLRDAERADAQDLAGQQAPRRQGREQQLDHARGFLLRHARRHGLPIDDQRREEDQHAHAQYPGVALSVAHLRVEDVHPQRTRRKRLERLLLRQTSRLHAGHGARPATARWAIRTAASERESCTTSRPSTIATSTSPSRTARSATARSRRRWMRALRPSA